ncbi:MAG: hypothetical protein UY92_C0004G0033 [Candidatus Magasanikbacteria bacterium GW2011_GWA2_56_11]|uniref:CxxC-x17-CxxC domain-containing protein n=1 Tax=Candidatus Magasanikbacteria bacterium GW2011_GWA2_56_11 TaxID=1619044 RepID=A0A0G2AN01_9BACT|nr:MAG: hypothetical protein UY92_C0004G0033 [Candidatus Magasanikbacteria bacterium GW2011_GWA2_56_11]
MAFYNKEKRTGAGGPNKFGGRGNKDRQFGGRGFGGRDAGRPAMYQAVCDKCGADCEVPFRPTGNRPVFCRACFGKQGAAQADRPAGRNFADPGYGNKRVREFDPGRSADKSTQNFKEQFDLLNAKLDRILETLAAPAPRTETPEEIEEEAAPVKVKKVKKAKKK